MVEDKSTGTFWDHLDALRSVLIRILALLMIATIVCFCCKDWLFTGIVLAPQRPDFPTYRLISYIGALMGVPDTEGNFTAIPIINTGMTKQLFIHVTMSFWVAILISSPAIIYAIFGFISPALYREERRLAAGLVGVGWILFITGVFLSYFVIFPLAFRFLGTYQVSESVANYISLESYVDTLIALTLMMGFLFELPVVCWLLAKLGILTPKFMRKYRKHALVVILIVAAVITPTTDIFTLALVTLPIYMLYELSILVVARTKISSEKAGEKLLKT